METQLQCSVCSSFYTPTPEELKLHFQGDLAIHVCSDCCAVKEVEINYTIED